MMTAGLATLTRWARLALEGPAWLAAWASRRSRRGDSGDRSYPWEASYPAGLRWRTEIEAKPLTAILEEAARAYPDNPCLDFFGKKHVYRDLADAVARVAAGMRALGVGKGARVGLMLPNCPYYVVCYFAVLAAGGTVVNYNPLYAAREIAEQVRDSGTRVMVTLDLKDMLAKVETLLAEGGLDHVVVCPMRDCLPFPERTLFTVVKWSEIARIPNGPAYVPFARLVEHEPSSAPTEIEPARDVAVVQYTGGTTGRPKGAMLTHANLYANALQTMLWAGVARPGEERILGVLPLFHAFGMTGVMNVGLMLGAELVLVPRFRLEELLKVIERRRPTIFVAVPAIYAAIGAYARIEACDLSSLRYCISGGAPLPQEVRRRFEALAGCRLVEGYGLTEAGPVCTVNPFDGEAKPGSAGLPLPGTVIEVRDRDDPDRLAAPGEAGEVCIAGPQVMAGYWRQPEENAYTLRGGRLHTGDIGHLDEEGYLFLIDRIKDVIVTGGYNVYPRVVEEAIYLHPAVEEAAVCGVPDSYRGETVKAFVKLREDAQLGEEELRAFLADKLAPFEVPRQVEFRDSLPKTLIGKVSRKDLLAEEAERLRRAGAAAEPAVAEPAA